MLAVAEMYIKGVSTRDAEAVMKEFGIESLSSSQVSRATKLLDDELEAWRNRSLGEVRYLIVDARYEKSRFGGVVRDIAVLTSVAGCWASRSRCQKQRSTGGPFLKACRTVACVGYAMWSLMTMRVCRPRERPFLAVPSGTKCHPSRPQHGDLQTHRR